MTWSLHADGQIKAFGRTSLELLVRLSARTARVTGVNIDRKKYAHRHTSELFIRSCVGTIDWLKWPGGHVARGARSVGLPHRPGNLARQRGLQIWPGRILSWRQSFKNGGSRQDSKEQLCLDLRKQPLGWLELGRNAAMVPWLERTRARDEAEKK